MIAIIPLLTRLLPAATRAAAGSSARGGAGRAMAGGMNAGEAERVKMFTMALGKATTAAFGLVVGWTKLSSVLLESRRTFAQFNATTAIAFANLDRQRTLRQFGTAGFTAGSTKDLAESIDRFESTIQPLKAGVMDGLNRLAAVGVDVVTAMVALAERIPWLGGKIDDWRKDLEKAQREGNAAQWAGLNYLAGQGDNGRFDKQKLGDL